MSMGDVVLDPAGMPANVAGAIAYRDLGDGREATVQPMTFGKGRLTVGPVGSLAYDDGW